MKNIAWSFFLGLSLISGLCRAEPAKSEKPKSVKEQCKDIKKELKELAKQKTAFNQEVLSFETQFGEAKTRFESYRARLSGMQGCSQGNPSNSSECLQVLAGLKQSGDAMTRAEQQRKEPARQKNNVENQMLTPTAMQKALKCPQ